MQEAPEGRPWVGLIWVDKTDDDGILAHCVVCSLHNWQETEWADGMMGAVAIALEAERPSTH